MPRLLLLRHAKAEPGSSSGDHGRALSERGHRAASDIGKAVAGHFTGPPTVLCSTALRTRQTWEAVKPSLADAPEPEFLRSIYEGADYLDIIRRHAGSAETVLLVGHNPTIHAAALGLSGSLEGRAASALARKFPTAALAVFDLDGEWAGLQPGGAQLRGFIVPPGSESD